MKIIEKPYLVSDENGTIEKTTIGMFGDIDFNFIFKKDLKTENLPGLCYDKEVLKKENIGRMNNFIDLPGYKKIDHVGFP